jgi:hypothetical protein
MEATPEKVVNTFLLLKVLKFILFNGKIVKNDRRKKCYG